MGTSKGDGHTIRDVHQPLKLPSSSRKTTVLLKCIARQCISVKQLFSLMNKAHQNHYGNRYVHTLSNALAMADPLGLLTSTNRSESFTSASNSIR